MKLLKNKKVSILVILLIISSVSLYIVKSEKDVLQKNIDLVFTNAIQDSINGLNLDYNKIDSEQKIQCYYQTLSNLHDALDVFYVSSDKEYDNLFQTLDRLYLYLLDNQSESYEIDDNLNIIEFLRKILFNPDDSQSISNFNRFLDDKN